MLPLKFGRIEYLPEPEIVMEFLQRLGLEVRKSFLKTIKFNLPCGPCTIIFLADGTLAVSRIDASHCSFRRICFKSLNIIP